MKSRNRLSRRDFLGTSTRTAAALGVGSLIAGRSAMSATRQIGANDRIQIALIGAGGRGRGDAAEACSADNVLCVGLCDVAEFRMVGTQAVVTQAMKSKGNENVKIDKFDDYRRLLDRKDIDAVIIATPDHWHMQPFIDALEAGKHVYQEKPMSYTFEQGLKMVEAAKKHPELTVQIGTQRRSGSHYPKAKELLDQGLIGDIRYVRAYDCRNYITGNDPFAPREFKGNLDWDKFQLPCSHKVKYDPWRYFAWRWYWDYAGGLVTDVGVHVMDVVHWLTGKDTPKSVVCNGGVYGLDYWETPDVVNAVWDYGSHSVVFTSNFTNGWEGDGLTLYGTKGTLEVRGHDIFIWAGDGQTRDAKPLHHWPNPGAPHQQNWIDCIRSGKTPNAPVEIGFKSLLPSHLANLAYRQGKKLTWDPVANKAT